MLPSLIERALSTRAWCIPLVKSPFLKSQHSRNLVILHHLMIHPMRLKEGAKSLFFNKVINKNVGGINLWYRNWSEGAWWIYTWNFNHRPLHVRPQEANMLRNRVTRLFIPFVRIYGKYMYLQRHDKMKHCRIDLQPLVQISYMIKH